MCAVAPTTHSFLHIRMRGLRAQPVVAERLRVLRAHSFLILVSLYHRIMGDSGIIKEQRKIASGLQHENNFGKTLGQSVITTAITVNDEKFDDNELKKLFVKNFNLYKNLERERNKNRTVEIIRKTRGAMNSTSYRGMECLSCFANGTSALDENCYRGSSLLKKECAETEVCFTEINFSFIRRGCIVPKKLNRTFVCKCYLCNDKPWNDSTYYDYNKISDWGYDNIRFQKPLAGIDLLCKVCDTTGTSEVSDKNCRLGRDADYMVCGRNQLCYVNIDNKLNYVSRGCTQMPVFNSMYYLCNKTSCNSKEFKNPKSKTHLREFVYSFLNKKLSRSRSYVVNIQYITTAILLILSVFYL
ncbi:uncharacterized protein LOC113509898 [Galleria mellonella]|uniref:Uncharacterized protein LOC113509898 n=1 Tax=Galleria mellonella TaxID=7137 RepID=A0ABM3MVK1_GALME|nr:uncharacterized protein LOC113509898 [Galleria mellonella]